jgi:hypothetical protein
MSNAILLQVLKTIETAIDSHATLTRNDFKHKEWASPASLSFTADGWIAECNIRAIVCKGRGSRSMTKARSHNPHETPEAAAQDLIEGLDTWAIVLS